MYKMRKCEKLFDFRPDHLQTTSICDVGLVAATTC